MAAPAMFVPPIIMSKLEKSAAFIKNPWLKAPATVSTPLCLIKCYTVFHLNVLFQVLLTGMCLTFSTPLCCALFPQRASIDLKDLEPALQEVKVFQNSALLPLLNKHFELIETPSTISWKR